MTDVEADRGPTSVDEICRGEIAVEQPRDGYRFNIDAVLLARFAAATAPVPPRRVIDLCAGCGLVGLLLARWWPEARATLVEVQAEMAALCRRNAARNGMAARTTVVEGDLRRVVGWAVEERPALAVCNPPFFPRGSGRPSPRPGVAAARHELNGTLAELIEAAGAGLPAGADLAMVHAADREGELLAALADRFAPRLLRRVLPLPGEPPVRILVAARRRERGQRASLQELPPLVVGDAPGRYSAEVRRMLGEGDW